VDGCDCQDFSIFDRSAAEQDRERYRSRGPDRTTRMLLDLIGRQVAVGASLLDVGGGIGVIDHEMLRAGVGHAVLVDASGPALEVARQEARASNVLDRLELIEDDFVRRADGIDAADIVTLDRVICCYPDAESLVSLSAGKARHIYGVVLPRDRLAARLWIRFVNLGFRIRRRGYRAFAHSNNRVDALVAEAGLRPRAESGTFLWRVVAYERPGTV
jgi:SAM-dependent methyltransferase